MVNYLRSHHLALVALFVALGGTSYAAIKLPANSVGPKQIKNNAVGSTEVKNGSLLKGDFKSGQLVSGPTGPQGPPGPKGDQGAPGSDAAGRDTWVTNPGDAQVLATDATKATLSNVPPGSYVITAEYTVSNNASNPRTVNCTLQAPGYAIQRTTTGETVGSRATGLVTIVYESAFSFTAILRCEAFGVNAGDVPVAGEVNMLDIQLLATAVGSVHHQP